MNFASFSSSFLSTNAAAFKVASNVFTTIDESKWQEQLAEAGIIGAAAVREFAVVWVSRKLKVQPKHGQRGWTFNGVNQKAQDKLDYLVKVATGSREGTKARAKSNAIDQAAKCVAAYNKLTASEKRAFLRAIGK